MMCFVGESVPVEEQLSSRNKKNSSETTVLTESVAPPTEEEKMQYEKLITDLYQQLDDKVGSAPPNQRLCCYI